MAGNASAESTVGIMNIFNNEQQVIDQLTAKNKIITTKLANKKEAFLNMERTLANRENNLYEERLMLSKIKEKNASVSEMLKEEKEKQYKLHLKLNAAEVEVSHLEKSRLAQKCKYSNELREMNRCQVEIHKRHWISLLKRCENSFNHATDS